MLYVIYSEDIKDSLEKRLAVRPQHILRLHQLKEEGRLVLAGPFPSIDSNEPGPVGFSGSLIVAEFSSLDIAQSWANEDPYIKAGVYSYSSVKPFNQVLP